MRKTRSLVLALLALAAAFLSRELQGALFWEPVPFPEGLAAMKVYRVATDGTTLYAGGVFSAFYVYTNVDAITNDGVSWTKLPDLPLSSVSLSYSCVDGGRPTKLVRISDDEPPRRYVAATWNPDLGIWTTGYTLTLPGETSPGSLGVFSHVFYLGTTAGELWSSLAGNWSVLPTDLPTKPGVARAPRLVVSDGIPYVVSETGLGVLRNGRVTVAEPRLLGRDVLDVARKDGVLYAYTRRADGRTEVSRLGASEETLALLDAGNTRGFLFFDGDDLYVAGPVNEPRLVSEGRTLSPRAREANPAWGFRVTTGDGTTTDFLGARYATSYTTLFRGRRRFVKNLPAVVGTSRYASELFVGNFSARPVEARITFRDEAGGAGASTLVVPLAPGAERRFPDAVAALRDAGAAPKTGDVVGSLSIEYLDKAVTSPSVPQLEDADLAASVRVVTRTSTGSYGVSLAASPSGSGLDTGGTVSGSGLLPGIRRDGATRTNIAAANAADGSGYPSAYCGGTCGRSPSIALTAPDGSGETSLSFTLPAGGRRQWNDVPPAGSSPAFTTAHGEAIPPGGATWDSQPSDDLLLYAVWNDAVTNDGALFPLQLPSRDTLRDALFLPFAGVVHGIGGLRYDTTLLLAQSRDTPLAAQRLRLRFRGAGSDGAVDAGFDLVLAAGTSLPVDDLRTFLRSHDPKGGVPETGDFSGSLRITSPDGLVSGLAASAVVAATRAGVPGRAFTSLDALASSRLARRGCVVPSLRADGELRTNLALANAEDSGGPSTRLTVTIHRAADGAAVAILPEILLFPGDRRQLDDLLAGLDIPSGADAYATISGDGAARFLAYGVLVDRTSGDGTVVSMVDVK